MVDKGVTTAELPVPVAALVGLVAMAAGLAVGHLVSGFISPSASPFFAVGSSADWSVCSLGCFPDAPAHPVCY
jgi:hypothetical protein